jgi:methylphosphotriester-DNA--protein-cysteine methyltransferase
MAGPLSAILERPEQAHTLDSLAATAAMSRSAFAAEFVACFGRTPIAFLRLSRVPHTSASDVGELLSMCSRSCSKKWETLSIDVWSCPGGNPLSAG